MQVNVYNNTGVSISVGAYVIEIGHNFFPIEAWAEISGNPTITELVANCGLLIENFEEYTQFKYALYYVTDLVMDTTREYTSESERENELKELESIKILIELYKSQFENDSRLKDKIASIDFAKAQEIIKARKIKKIEAK